LQFTGFAGDGHEGAARLLPGDHGRSMLQRVGRLDQISCKNSVLVHGRFFDLESALHGIEWLAAVAAALPTGRQPKEHEPQAMRSRRARGALSCSELMFLPLLTATRVVGCADRASTLLLLSRFDAGRDVSPMPDSRGL